LLKIRIKAGAKKAASSNQLAVFLFYKYFVLKKRPPIKIALIGGFDVFFKKKIPEIVRFV
jgi:hypothetical protein